MATLNGNEVASNKRYSQVYQATHKGEKILPFMNRSFISFTYGGKKIEDFDLIATISGDRISRNAYAGFNDTVTTYDNLDGQYYWSTHYKTNQLDFVLSTDGIDQRQLDNFLYWFKAGVTRELILAEHPNRGIMARVAQPPQISLLPFESTVQITLSSETYTTKTTLYKGDIQLSLVMDSPHWYSIVNILGQKVEEGGKIKYVDIWHDITEDRDVSIFASQDALKILYEDGIPLGSMIGTNMLLGNGAYANVENQIISLTWSKLEDADDFAQGEGAKIDNGDGTKGIIAGAIVNANDEGISELEAGIPAYFYYAGTAPAYTIISFTLKPVYDGNYIAVPGNKSASLYNDNHPYNTITIQGETTQTLRFTTPNIFTSYNNAVKIIEKTVDSAHTWEQVREALRDGVRHAKVREYAIQVINAISAQTIGTDKQSTIITNLKGMFNYNGAPKPASFRFNSETGEAVGYFSYKEYGSGIFLDDQEEDVGDMLKSNYIIIQDRNYPDSYGKIIGWQDTAEGHSYSHRIMHDVYGGLTNFQILYKNMYL